MAQNETTREPPIAGGLIEWLAGVPPLYPQQRPGETIIVTQEIGTDDEDWATVRALLLAGCSLPYRLHEKYEAHMRRVRKALVIGLKRVEDDG